MNRLPIKILGIVSLFLFSCSLALGQSEEVKEIKEVQKELREQYKKERAARKKAQKAARKARIIERRAKAQLNKNKRLIKKSRSKKKKSEKLTSKHKEKQHNETISLEDANAVVKEAQNLLGIRYRYGGEKPSSGFDCSGFTKFVFYKAIQKIIPRNSNEQYRAGKRIPLRNAISGDLIFFSNGKKVDHVGIIVSNKGEDIHMIHASSSVGIQLINIETSSYWSRRIKAVRRF